MLVSVVIASAMFIPGVLYAWLDLRIRLRQESSSTVPLRTS